MSQSHHTSVIRVATNHHSFTRTHFPEVGLSSSAIINPFTWAYKELITLISVIDASSSSSSSDSRRFPAPLSHFLMTDAIVEDSTLPPISATLPPPLQRKAVDIVHFI